MYVEDLVDRDRVRLRLRRLRPRRRQLRRDRLHRLDLVHGPARDCQHHDESDLALRARHLQVKSLLLVAQYLYVAALQAAAADGTVVKASPIADELDDAHRPPILRCTTRPHRRPSMHVQPASPTTAECTVPARKTMRSPAFRRSSLPSRSSTNLIEPSTQYSTFS